MAGRGWGKTRVGAEITNQVVETGQVRHITIAGATAGDVRDIIVEGESGILACSPPWNMPRYEPSKRRLTWPNGARALLISADEPERFRGKQHEFVWCDELAAWQYDRDAWDQLMFGLRLGNNPRGIVTTTPRPTDLIKELIGREDSVVVRGSTHDNRANLADGFFRDIIRRYEGTRLGRQEIYAEVLDDNPGALWRQKQIDELRVDHLPRMRRIVVAVDPAVSADEDSDETGIVVCGVGEDGFGYVIADHSGIYTPSEWAELVAALYHRYSADRVIAEVNQGGDLVERNLRTANEVISFRAVRATRGKVVRAEPVAALYEQKRVYHLGCLPKLEDQMCNWDPAFSDKSPDRVDALVWGITDLMLMVKVGPKVKLESVGPRESVFDGDSGW